MIADGFSLHQPTTTTEAIALAERFRGEARFFAGGTDVLPGLFQRREAPKHLIALERIGELSEFAPDRGHIGSMVHLAALERDAQVRARFTAVAEAARRAASPALRASGTVGGNLLLDPRCLFYDQTAFWRDSVGGCLKTGADVCRVVPSSSRCYAVYCGDLAPAFLVLGASVVVEGPTGRRTIPLEDLYPASGDGKSPFSTGRSDIVVAVELPSGLKVHSSYAKLRPRGAPDFSEASVAVALAVGKQGLEYFRVAVGGVEPRPRLFDELTQPWIGRTPTAEQVHELAAEIVRRVRPVANTSLFTDYRKHVVAHFLRRDIHALLEASAAH